MSTAARRTPNATMDEAVGRLREATAAAKCWPCGCFHEAIEAIRRNVPPERRGADLDEAIRQAGERLVRVRYECLGCDICYPALAVNALREVQGEWIERTECCPSGDLACREGWPPLPGDYSVLRYRAPVAVCTLTDGELSSAVAQNARHAVSLVGTLHTENLGIERIILNLMANPHIRFLVLCGPDSRQAVGHLPGQSFLALARSGVDDSGRIVGAKGRRPVLRNVPRNVIEDFRRMVEVVDLVGCRELPRIASAIAECAARDPGAREQVSAGRGVAPIRGSVPERMVADPSGYCVIGVDRTRRVLWLEHYRNDGALDAVIEGRVAAELYLPAIERGLVSRLDHAAYLGRELARAEQALWTGETYVQDGAPDCTAG